MLNARLENAIYDFVTGCEGVIDAGVCEFENQCSLAAKGGENCV